MIAAEYFSEFGGETTIEYDTYSKSERTGGSESTYTYNEQKTNCSSSICPNLTGRAMFFYCLYSPFAFFYKKLSLYHIFCFFKKNVDKTFFLVYTNNRNNPLGYVRESLACLLLFVKYNEEIATKGENFGCYEYRA